MYCNCGIPDYLISCTACSNAVCFRRDEFLEERPSTPRVEADGEKLEEEHDTFHHEQACLIFDHYKRDTTRRSLQSIKRDFVCPSCWDHNRTRSYPVSPYPAKVPRTLGDHYNSLPLSILFGQCRAPLWSRSISRCHAWSCLFFTSNRFGLRQNIFVARLEGVGAVTVGR
jgi:hypothetical protein